MSKVFFASDLHFDHQSITKYRPFETVEEHNAVVFDGLMQPAGKRNTLWLLGDNCFSLDSLKYIRQLSEAYGKVNVVLGNHDTDRTERREVIRRIVMGGLADIYGLVSYKGFWLSHAPLHVDELRGKRNIHGHLHGRSVGDGHLYQCVSMEQINYHPIEFGLLKERFNEGFIFDPAD